MTENGEVFGGGVYRISGIVSNLIAVNPQSNTYTFCLEDFGGQLIRCLGETVGVKTVKGMNHKTNVVTFGKSITFRYADHDSILHNGKIAVVHVDPSEVQRAIESGSLTPTIDVSSVL